MKDINICLGRFQPFTKGHLRLPEAGKKENGLPCVVFMIHNKKMDARHPFPDELIQKEMDIIKKRYKNLIVDTFYVASADIKEIARICHENGYEPRLWLTGTDRYNVYKKMATSPKYQKEFGLRSDFDAFEVKRTDDDISATKVREALKNDDKKTYDEMMLVDDIKLYNEFKETMKNIKECKMKNLKDYINESLGDSDSDIKRYAKEYLKANHKSLSKSNIKSYIEGFEEGEGDFYNDPDGYEEKYGQTTNCKDDDVVVWQAGYDKVKEVLGV